MKKFDIINGLARQYGFTRYLEICTTTTGRRFDHVHADPLTTRHRLVYRCPETYDDGCTITFRTANESSYELIRAIDPALANETRYDIILIDSYHSYDSSLLDLHGAMCLLRPGGVLVVHDCNPRDERVVGPTFKEGDWCGQTYQAFVDFALSVRSAGYCTVDADFGCGVVYGTETSIPEPWERYRPSPNLVFGWTIAWHAGRSGFEYFRQNRDALLNVVSAEAFAAAHPDVARAISARTSRDEPIAEPAGERPAPRGNGIHVDPITNGHAGEPVDIVEGRPITADPDLHLLADGQRLDPIRCDENSWTFDVSGHDRPPYLVSHACRPSDLGLSEDSRLLGIRVHEIKAEAEGRAVSVAANRDAFNEGFYSCEHDMNGGHWRWTNGRGQVPSFLWEQLSRPATLTITGSPMQLYLVAPGQDRPAQGLASSI